MAALKSAIESNCGKLSLSCEQFHRVIRKLSRINWEEGVNQGQFVGDDCLYYDEYPNVGIAVSSYRTARGIVYYADYNRGALTLLKDAAGIVD